MSFCFVSAEKIEGAFEVPDRGRENAIRHNRATDAKYNARAISLHDAERRSSSSSFSVERECVYSGPERTLIRSWVMLLHRHVFHLNIANVPFFVRGTPSLHDFRSRSCAQLRCDSSHDRADIAKHTPVATSNERISVIRIFFFCCLRLRFEL